MTNRAPLARARFSVGGASDYLTMVKYDAQTAYGTTINALTEYTRPSVRNLQRLYYERLFATTPTRVCTTLWTKSGHQMAGPADAVAYGNGTIVMSVYSGLETFILYSTDDGVTFQEANGSVLKSGRCYSIAFGDGMFVAVGEQGVINPDTFESDDPNNYYSTNGIDWTPQKFPLFATSRHVSFWNERWIVTNAYLNPYVTDGYPSGITNIHSYSKNGGQLSVDGLFPGMQNITGVAKDERGATVFVGQNIEYTVIDGMESTTYYGYSALVMVPNVITMVIGDRTTIWSGVAYGGGVWVMIGILSDYSTYVMRYSTNATTWNSCNGDPFTGGAVYKVRYINGAFYAVGVIAGGLGRIVKSVNGQDWTTMTGLPPMTYEFTDITADSNGNLVAVGQSVVLSREVCS